MKWKLLSAAIASCALITAAYAQEDPMAPAETPATQPARSRSEIQEDLKAAAMELHNAMPTHDEMMDPAARAKAAPTAIPALKKMIAALDEAIPVASPPSRSQLMVLKYHLLGTLSLLGDGDAKILLEADATGHDKDKALSATLALLSADWIRNNADAAAQGKILDRIDTMVKADPSSDILASTALSMAMGGAATPALSDRAKDIAMNESTSPFSQHQKQSMTAKARLAALENKPLVIEGHDVAGQPFSSSQYAGKVILVDFWATWCGPCKGELPRLKKIYAENHDKGFEIIGVSLDYEADALKAFLKADPAMSWVELYEPGEKGNPLAVKFGIEAIPRMLLIDRNGVCRTVEAREKLEEMLPKLLAEPVTSKHAG